ncbi:MAG: class I SAM-dependent methyltransferase [Magnetococcales bacterium]|nr:class I SAM-dependent methyltransferase [Magnetococcales bacterium]
MNRSEATRQRWDRTALFFDLMAGFGPEKRWFPFKRELFARMTGKVLFLAVGTGLDIPAFPPGLEIVGIDISPAMLEKARTRAERYPGKMTLQVMDVGAMTFADRSFDQVFTSCTFCSVPDPAEGLRSIRRVLKPGGWLRMFEHTGSDVFPFGSLLNFMNPLCRHIGPEMNRDTVARVREAGFRIHRVNHLYLDVVKTIEACLPAEGGER